MHRRLDRLVAALLLLAPVALPARSLHLSGSDVVTVRLRAPLPRQVTIEAWLRSSVDEQLGLPLYAGRLGASADGYGLQVHDGVRAIAGDQASVSVTGGGLSITGSSIPLRRGEWVHVALVRDDSLWYLYRNGMLAGRGKGLGVEPSPQLHIGHLFSGEIDEVRVWSIARRGDEIARSIASPVDPAAAGLVARFSMEALDGSVLRNDAATARDFDGSAIEGAVSSLGINADNAPVTRGEAPRIELARFPRHRHFLPREVDDSATVAIEGRALNGACDAVRLELTRDGDVVSVREIALDATRQFALATRIRSELALYTVRLSGRVDGEWRQIAEAADIVAGDVYLIAGQSNSHPSSPAATWTSPFVRSFGIQTRGSNYGTYDPADTLFDIANAHGFDWGYSGPYLVGVWGMRLAEHLLAALERPVFFVNGGTGGSSIEENARSVADPGDLSTIYGRTLHRLERAGLREHVRAILWHQGESNGIYNYYENFRALRDGWRHDYPAATRVYLFQIRPGCGGSSHLALRELQRTIADSLDGVTVLATVGLPGHDGCHFYDEGYRAMGDQIARFVLRDAGASDGLQGALRYPDIARAWFTSERHDEVALLFRTSAPLVWSGDTLVDGAMRSLASAFFFGDDLDVVDGGTVRGDTVLLHLSRAIDARTVSYVPDKFYPGTSTLYEGPWLVDREGLGALAFHAIAIEEPRAEPAPAPVAAALTVSPNPAAGISEARFALEAPAYVRLRVVDPSGRSRVLVDGPLAAGAHRYALDGMPAGAYQLVLERDGIRESARAVIVR